MDQYTVTGMSCAACQARVEKAVSKVPGVESCSVSLLTNSMGVEGTASAGDIIKAVENAGYGAAPKAKPDTGSAGASGSLYAAEEAALEDHETPVLKKRLIASLGFLIVLMYVSMGHMMFGFPLPGFLEGNHVAMGLVQLLLAGIVMVINQKFFVSGFKGLIHGAPNMDTLVAMGSMASFCWSTFVLFRMTGHVLAGNDAAVMTDMHEFYFESAAMIVTLITVGKMLEAMSKGRTTDALKGLMKLAPDTAVVVRDGEEREVPVAQVRQGDIFVVRPGENVPVDGIITEGSTAVDESALTGESIPVDKTAGDPVSAATTNMSGYFRAEATRVGQDTTLSQIIKMVSDAAATKAPIAKIADKVAGVFVPAVIGIAVVTAIIWLLVGQTAGYALARAISVLVISCPCALGLATPVAIMVGSGVGAKNGILFKTAASIEETGRISVIALDKTGTITKGEPQVTGIYPAEGTDEFDLMRLAYALEKPSEHPLARAIVARAEQDAVTADEIADFRAESGSGVRAVRNGKEICGGNMAFIEKRVSVNGAGKALFGKLSDEGKTCLFFSEGDEYRGMIAVADTIKEDSAEAIAQLKNMGVRVVMLTGDNEKTARAIGEQAGVDDVIAGVLPDGKESVIRELQKTGKVAMVGDGINDAPALTRADMGIAIGAGADVAIDAANVVLMNSRLSDVAAAVRLSRATLRNIHQNLFWAFFYNVLGIPLAAGAYIHLFGWAMNPMFGAAAMSLSSFFVVTNALRLNLINIHDPSKDKKIKTAHAAPAGISEAAEDNQYNKAASAELIEEDTMEKTMKIEGMMCMHCEATVKKSLEALEGVASADVSHEKGTAVVTMTQDVPDDVLKQAVEAKDYTVLAVE